MLQSAMNEVQKVLAKLPKEYKTSFDILMLRLLARDFMGLNIARLKGHKDIYRVKQGRLRVIYRMDGRNLSVLEVGLRSEKTYRNF